LTPSGRRRMIPGAGRDVVLSDGMDLAYTVMSLRRARLGSRGEERKTPHVKRAPRTERNVLKTVQPDKK